MVSFGDPAMVRAVGLTMSNAFMSIWCVLYGKWMLMLFPASNVLMLCQGLVTVVVLLVLKAAGVMTDPGIRLSLPPQWRPLLLIAIFYAANVMFGLLSLKFLTVPMFSVLKRGTIPAAFLGELLFLAQRNVAQTFPAIVVMLTGSVIAAVYDLHFSAIGYLVGAISCCSQAASFVLSKKLSTGRASESEWAIVYFNSAVSVVLILPVILLDSAEMGVVSKLLAAPSANILMHLFLNGVSVLLLNYCIFMNCNVNSPLTVGITGQLKAVLQIIFGIIAFGHSPGILSSIGVVLNILGGAWYAYVKYQQNYARPRHEPSSLALTAVHSTDDIPATKV